MPGNNSIHYFQQAEIHKKKWDARIDSASNGLIYSYSFYLDHMAKNWDALVLNDYEAVMPLTWNKKFGFYYLYQPAFTASLGIFGKSLTEDLTSQFLDAIPKKFKLTEICLNSANATPALSHLKKNYLLDLNKPETTIRQAFRENHKRNISKAFQMGCTRSRDIEVDEIISLNREQLRKISGTKPEDYVQFKKLFAFLKQKGQAKTLGIRSKSGELYASAVFFYSHNRAYYILVGNHPDGKTIGASHALISFFIEEHAGQNLVLDFEGSDITNLAFFYAGFGAQEELYPALKINNLPPLLRWLKS